MANDRSTGPAAVLLLRHNISLSAQPSLVRASCVVIVALGISEPNECGVQRLIVPAHLCNCATYFSNAKAFFLPSLLEHN
jgi:hypothetical protein